MGIQNSKNIFIGVDGGATNTRGVLFDIKGDTFAHSMTKGSNLSVYNKVAAERICYLIQDLISKSSIDYQSIKCIGLGIAGSSDRDGRDILFKELIFAYVLSTSPCCMPRKFFLAFITRFIYKF